MALAGLILWLKIGRLPIDGIQGLPEIKIDPLNKVTIICKIAVQKGIISGVNNLRPGKADIKINLLPLSNYQNHP